jgi:hypothetical protein
LLPIATLMPAIDFLRHAAMLIFDDVTPFSCADISIIFADVFTSPLTFFFDY